MASAAVTTNPRRSWVGGNWKCNGTRDSLTALIEAWNAAGDIPSNVDVVICPAAIHLGLTQSLLRKDFKLAAQNIWKENKFGAFTGELCAPMVKDFGIDTVLVGHSERRHVFGESDEVVAAKVQTALSNGLDVIYCIGETLEEREADKTMEVNQRQLAAVTEIISKMEAWEKLVIAYEPVWAIGTGKVATPTQAQEVHKALRSWISSNVSEEVAASVRIVYGGSVKPANCKALSAEPDIDGFLVGGASLKPDFIEIINARAAQSSSL